MQPRKTTRSTVAKGIRFRPEVLSRLRPYAKRRGYSVAVNELLTKALDAEEAKKREVAA